MNSELSKRYSTNCIAYIIIYGIIGMISGLVFDALVTYLLAVSPDIANSMASFMGLGSLAASFIAVFAPRTGFKKMIAFAVIIITASLTLITSIQTQWLIGICIFLVMTGTTLFDVMLAPFIATYTTLSNRAAFFTKASLSSVLGIILGTFIGGPMIIYTYSNKLNITYMEAMALTKNLGSLSLYQYSCYVDSHRSILLLFAVISSTMIVPCFKIKEAEEDYKTKAITEEDKKHGLSVFINKYVILFMLYTLLTRISSSLIVPQLSIFLTNIGLNRVTISLLSTLQYFSILIFVVLSSKIMSNMGLISSISALYLTSVPFMIILANGYKYGAHVELIIGTALFFRAGLANAAIPFVDSLTMSLVHKNYRSLYSSILFLLQSLSQVLAGLFTKYYLFKEYIGYANAYYYAAALNIISHILLLAFFSKKYNQLKISSK